MCIIVDEQNNVIGAATRRETVSKRLLGRGAYVLVFDSAGQLFVSRRR
jgi:isopentenyldiphosphate isomerase